MSSTSQNKKEIVDFLWEWGETNNDWGKLLVHKIVSTETSLSTHDRQEIFKYFLQAINLHSGLPKLKTSKPTYTPTSKQIELISLSDIKGVNRLAKNQTVNFAKNITVIYGENGTGKTGYSRILRALGFSYDTYNKILPNIYETSESQAATIKFDTNGAQEVFNWDGKNSQTELENISVFNSSCVKFSISDRNLLVSPIGFHLFNLISNELNELNALLQTKIASHKTSISWIENLKQGTEQHKYITTLSAHSTIQKLTELSTFTEQQASELTEKKDELENLNKTLLQTEGQNLSSQINELDTIISNIHTTQKQFTSSIWSGLIGLNKQISELEGKAQTGLKDIAEKRGIELYETPEFNSFIRAAENYIKIFDESNYPQEEDACVFCLQPLEDPAQELLKSYRTLLNDKTQEEMKRLKKKKSEVIQRISEIDVNLIFHHGTFGLDENKLPVQPTELVNYNAELGLLKTNFITDKVKAESKFSFDYSKYSKFFTAKRTVLNDDKTTKQQALSNLELQEKVLRARIGELKDRKYLSGKVEEVKTVIENHKIVDTLNSNSGKFNTTSISRKTSSARDELVKQDFNDQFKTELRALRKSNLKIELSFGTDRGSSKVYQKISSHALADILSEGEQKAIALAEFLTELQLDNTRAPIIFDDPVNSLDHRIIDEVAKRLIELSKERQIIVFTHSILLLHSFIQQSELDHHRQAGVHFKFHRVKENFGVTGILDEVEYVNSFSYYIKKLNELLQTNPKGQDESKLAAEGYGHLRSAIEITVEDDLFKKTIKRYKKGVAFPALLRIEGTKIDAHKGKLNDIYEKCCVSIVAHSSPESIHTSPTVAELKIDFEEFKKLRKVFH